MKLSRALCCFIFIVLGNLQVSAQGNESRASKRWIKTLSREIDTRDSLDSRGKLHHAQTGDIQLLEYLKQLSIHRKVRSYYPFDLQSIRDNRPVISKEYILNAYCPADDTDRDLVDSLGFKVYQKKVYHRDCFPTARDNKLRLLEEWVFDPISRITKIHLLAIGLVREHELADHSYGGNYALFWLSWEDLVGVFEEDRQQALKNRLSQYIWQDYFSYQHLFFDTSSQNEISNWFSASYASMVKIEPHYDTALHDHHLTYIGNWTALSQLLYDSVRSKVITAYGLKNGRLTNKLMQQDILVEYKRDTEVIDDTANGITITKVSMHDVQWDLFNNYRVLQSWNFDANTGQTTIKIEGISPAFDNWEYEFAPPVFTQLFWVKLDDIKPLLDDYDIYCPFQNLSRSIWESYFVPQPFMGLDHWKE